MYPFNHLGVIAMQYPNGRTVSYPVDAAGRASGAKGTLGGSSTRIWEFGGIVNTGGNDVSGDGSAGFDEAGGGRARIV